MNEQQLFELLGRKQALIEQQARDLTFLLGLVRGLKDGSISMDRVSFDPNGECRLGPAVAAEEAA